MKINFNLKNSLSLYSSNVVIVFFHEMFNKNITVKVTMLNSSFCTGRILN